MSKWLRKTSAMKCPIHQAILTQCLDELTTKGFFRKDDILEHLRFKAVEDAIRWDYIRSFIEDGEGGELIPLAERFFKRHSAEKERLNPEKYMAMGYGKKTAGYALVCVDHEHLAICRLKHKKHTLNGVGKAFNQYVELCNDKLSKDVLEEQPKIESST